MEPESKFTVHLQNSPAFDVRLQSAPTLDDWEAISPDNETIIQKTLKEERGVEVRFFHSSSNIKEYIMHVFQKASELTDCPYDLEPISVIIVELIQNALKANFKKVYFKQQHIDHKNADQYKEALTDFKQKISKETSMLADLATKEALSVSVQIFALSSNCIKVRVINNAPLYEIEARRIKEKLANTLKYETLLDFFQETHDETEGAGLGMLVIVLSLRDLGLSSNHFSVFQDEQNHTVASVLFSW